MAEIDILIKSITILVSRPPNILDRATALKWFASSWIYSVDDLIQLSRDFVTNKVKIIGPFEIFEHFSVIWPMVRHSSACTKH